MKYFFIILFCIGCDSKCLAQDNIKAYMNSIKKADSLFVLKQYDTASRLYTKAFIQTNGQGKIKDRLSAAFCWTMNNNYDSAFYQLFRVAINAKYTDSKMLLEHPNLKALHTDARWSQLIQIVKKNEEDVLMLLSNQDQ